MVRLVQLEGGTGRSGEKIVHDFGSGACRTVSTLRNVKKRGGEGIVAHVNMVQEREIRTAIRNCRDADVYRGGEMG